MNWRQHFFGGGILLLVGLLAVAAVGFGTRGSVREHIRSQYTPVAPTAGGVPGEGGSQASRSLEFSSPEAPSVVAASIADKWKPAERIADPSGFFLRYRNDIVAVTPGPDGQGSRIFVDDERRGYARWYPYVGGYWGTFSGPGEGFRGGGPGAGK